MRTSEDLLEEISTLEVKVEDLTGDLKIAQAELAKVRQVAKELNASLVAARYELNVIRARDGVPYCYDGIKSDVDANYFSRIVDSADKALASAKGIGL